MAQARKHDRPRRLLFTHPRMVADLLRAFTPLHWVEGIDFSTLEKLGTDYVTTIGGQLRERVGDVVWQVKRDGRRVLVLLIEFQSSPEPFMAIRLAEYVVLFYQRLIREEKLRRGDKLPPILAILLYNGEEPYGESTEVEGLLDGVPAELAAYQLGLRYVLIDEHRWPREKLREARRNAVAAFLRLERSGPGEIRELILKDLLLDWIDAEERVLMQDLLAWISLVLLPERRPELPVPSFQTLDELKGFMEEDMETWSDMLLNQGRVEGRTEGQTTIVLAQLEARFGSVGEAVRRRVLSASGDQLLTWAKRVLTAERLDDVFSDNGAR